MVAYIQVLLLSMLALLFCLCGSQITQTATYSTTTAPNATTTTTATTTPPTTTTWYPPKVVQMTVYYDVHMDSETSRNFITKQLYPLYLALHEESPYKQMIQLKLVPNMNVKMLYYRYEKSLLRYCKYYPGGGASSEYVSRERSACLSAKIHACAVANIPNELQRLAFIECLVSNTGLDICVDRICVRDTPFALCINSVDGDTLMDENFDRAAEFKLRSTLNVPAVVVTFDGVYDEDEQDKARGNLLQLVCEKYRTRFAGLTPLCDTSRAQKTMTHDNFGTNFVYSVKRKCDF